MFIQLTHSQQLLIALLKLALWNTVPDKALFENTNDTVWKEVFQLSAGQGVKAIAYDGVMRLPLEFQPSYAIKFEWAVHVEIIERRYEKEWTVANEIAEIYANNNIKMLLFKGFGLAQYYPAPNHREFGDIDIYLFGKKEEGDRLLFEAGAGKKKRQCDRHSALIYKGVLIENHDYFLPENDFYNVAIIEKRLSDALANDRLLNNSLITKAISPSPDFNILQMVSHSFEHFFGRSILLRYLCDWALFLEANKGAIDFAAFRRLISEAGFIKFADALTALSIRYLDLNPKFAPPVENNAAIEDKIMQDMFKSLSSPEIEKQTWLKRVRFKLKTLNSIKWKYNEIFNSKQFYKVIRHSIFLHISHSMSILKMF